MKTVRTSSVSLSPVLNKNDKVKQYIRKKTHKPLSDSLNNHNKSQ